MSGFFVPGGLDPDEAADWAREEVEAEIAWAEEREREREEEYERKQALKNAEFDAALDRYQEEEWERSLTRSTRRSGSD